MIIELLILFVIIILSAILNGKSLNINESEQFSIKCMDTAFFTSLSVYSIDQQVQNIGISKAAAINLSPLFCSHNGRVR